jgi:uncharacterized protein (DUF1810 family)
MALERFHEAQASRSTGYDTALAEIRQGRKTSHWIWYIFPQLDGLGHSSPPASTPSAIWPKPARTCATRSSARAMKK